MYVSPTSNALVANGVDVQEFENDSQPAAPSCALHNRAMLDHYFFEGHNGYNGSIQNTRCEQRTKR